VQPALVLLVVVEVVLPAPALLAFPVVAASAPAVVRPPLAAVFPAQEVSVPVVVFLMVVVLPAVVALQAVQEPTEPGAWEASGPGAPEEPELVSEPAAPSGSEAVVAAVQAEPGAECAPEPAESPEFESWPGEQMELECAAGLAGQPGRAPLSVVQAAVSVRAVGECAAET
jgi:hypothetical protein